MTMDDEVKQIIAVFLMVAFSVLLGLYIGEYVHDQEKIVACSSDVVSADVLNLPSDAYVRSFCRDRGFDGGWIDMTVCRGIDCYTKHSSGFDNKCFGVAE